MKTFKTLLICLVLASYAQKIAAQQTNVEVIMKPIDEFINQKMTESGMVGIGAALIVNKEVVWMKGYGFADKDSNKPFTPNTIMNIGSISKTITGVALMRAIEEKKISLDEDINLYLPFKLINPFFPKEKITLRNLATHTSSIHDVEKVYNATYSYGSDPKESLESFMKNYFMPSGKYYSEENFLNAKPGTNREYSNIAAGLAGYIVELKTGLKLNKYTERYIFNPLKMNASGWFFSEINRANHATLYDKQGEETKPIELYGMVTYPDGGMRTSVSDLSKVFCALLNDGTYKGTRILKRESVEEMLKYQFTASNKPENVDIEKLNSGIFWATKLNATRIGHGGSDPGLKTEMLADLNKDVGIILFTNTSLSDANMAKCYMAIYNELYKFGSKIKEIN